MAPLGAIREAEQDPVRKDTYNLMYRNCLRINRIVNQLMDLRKIDAGQMQLFFRETDIVYFIRDIMQSFGKLAESKRVDFSLTSAHPEETLWIDQGNFDKIVYNILSNAFKHTPDGGRIRVDVDRGGLDQPRLRPLRAGESARRQFGLGRGPQPDENARGTASRAHFCRE